MFVALLKGPVGLFCAFPLFFVGLGCMFYLDRVPAGWPDWQVHKWGVNFAIHAPESLGAKLTAADGKLKLALANVDTLQSAIDGQNAAIQREASRSADALADAEDAIRAARAPVAKAAQSRVVIAAAATVGPTACDRAQSVDRAFVRSLK